MNQGKSTTPESRPGDTSSCEEGRDLRQHILLVFALVLLLAQWTGWSRPPWQGAGEGENAPVDMVPLWLTGSRVQSGLYEVPADWLASEQGLATLYTEMELTPPAGGYDLVVELDSGPTGLHLEDGLPPARAEVPARIFPLLDAPLPINRCTEKEVAMLPGIGPRLAQRIVALREARGGFTGKDELLAVRGIGPGKFDRIRDLISLE